MQCLKVYKLSIGAACGLAWPPDRFIVQVLDDSTDPIVKVPHAQLITFSNLLELCRDFTEFKRCDFVGKMRKRWEV